MISWNVTRLSLSVLWVFTMMLGDYGPTATHGFVIVSWTASKRQSHGSSPPPRLGHSTKKFSEKPEKNARVRFSGAEGLTSTTTNPLDAALTFLASDIVSIALGLLGLVVIVGHRFSLLDDTSAETLTVQTRTDLLAVFACGSVLLDGITKLDVTAAMAEAVVLEGIQLSEPEMYENGSRKDEAAILWALESLLVATPAKTAVVLERSSEENWKVLARAGIVPKGLDVPESTPILERVSGPGNKKETYLPTLQALPGKRELPYLPANAQLALMIPIVEDSADKTSRVLVLGSNQAKSFTPRDVAWCKIVAERMASTQ